MWEYLSSDRVAEGNQMGRSSSITSLESILPPPAPFKTALLWGILMLVVLTLFELVVACIYTAIGGNASYYYSNPHTWQFCLVYADLTIEYYDSKIVDAVGSSFAYLGLLNCLYTWVALAATFRALNHIDWIPSTIVLLIYIAFGQLCYFQVRRVVSLESSSATRPDPHVALRRPFQNTPLIMAPSSLSTSLLAVTQWVSTDMYDNIGHVSRLMPWRPSSSHQLTLLIVARTSRFSPMTV